MVKVLSQGCWEKFGKCLDGMHRLAAWSLPPGASAVATLLRGWVGF